MAHTTAECTFSLGMNSCTTWTATRSIEPQCECDNNKTEVGSSQHEEQFCNFSIKVGRGKLKEEKIRVVSA